MAPMSNMFMLAGGIVEPGAGQTGAVSAFVAYNPRPGISRLFKVAGPAGSPAVTELPGATTVDLGRFRQELAEELQPALDAIAARGGAGAIAVPKAEWIASVVRQHLAEHEGDGGA
jgi:hypothetical protein